MPWSRQPLPPNGAGVARDGSTLVTGLTITRLSGCPMEDGHARSKKAAVEDFLAELPHPRKVEKIEELRAAILGADQAIGEQVKWNAPSFGVDGDDGTTFRLQPGDRVGVDLPLRSRQTLRHRFILVR